MLHAKSTHPEVVQRPKAASQAPQQSARYSPTNPTTSLSCLFKNVSNSGQQHKHIMPHSASRSPAPDQSVPLATQYYLVRGNFLAADAPEHNISYACAHALAISQQRVARHGPITRPAKVIPETLAYSR